MEAFQQEHPEFGSGLLSFTLEYVLVNKWPDNGLMTDYNDCILLCDVEKFGTDRDCGCTCTTDMDDWTDAEVA